MRTLGGRLSAFLLTVIAVVAMAGCGGSKPKSDQARARQIRDYLVGKYAHSTGEWLTPVNQRTHGPGTYPGDPNLTGAAKPGSIEVSVRLDTAVVNEYYATNGDGSLYAYGPSEAGVCEAVLDGGFKDINHVRVYGVRNVECP